MIKNILIKLLTYLIMLPIIAIGIIVAIVWNTYLIFNYIFFRLKRKWAAGIKEVKKTSPKQ
jgi:hypothetical protein